MTPEEYTQLKAFARIDGAKIGLAWVASFALIIIGLTRPPLGLLGTIIAMVSPFVAINMLRRFREKVRDGYISFGRGFAYYMLIFIYASLWLALAQYVYFAFIDNGYMYAFYSDSLLNADTQQILSSWGVTKEQVKAELDIMKQTKPMTIVLNVASFNIMVGLLMGLPSALALQRKGTCGNSQHT